MPPVLFTIHLKSSFSIWLWNVKQVLHFSAAWTKKKVWNLFLSTKHLSVLQFKRKQGPVSNPKLFKSCGMGSWCRSGEEQSVGGINPSPGGLHLAPYPHHELSTRSSQLPDGFDFSSITLSCLWGFYFMSTHVFDVHLISVVYETPSDKGDLVTVHKSLWCLSSTAAMPDHCLGTTEKWFRLFTFKLPCVEYM